MNVKRRQRKKKQSYNTHSTKTVATLSLSILWNFNSWYLNLFLLLKWDIFEIQPQLILHFYKKRVIFLSFSIFKMNGIKIHVWIYVWRLFSSLSNNISSLNMQIIIHHMCCWACVLYSEQKNWPNKFLLYSGHILTVLKFIPNITSQYEKKLIIVVGLRSCSSNRLFFKMSHSRCE